MSTYEVENIFYNNYGGVQTKSCDLFATKNQAIKHMKKIFIKLPLVEFSSYEY